MEVASAGGQTMVRADLPVNTKRLVWSNVFVTLVALILAIVAIVMAQDDDSSSDGTDVTELVAASTYTREQADASFATKDSTYSRQQADAAFAGKADTYTRQQADAAFAGKADIMTKVQADAAYAGKTDSYTKADADATFITQAAVDQYVSKADLNTAMQSAAAQRNIKIAMVAHGHDDNAFWRDNVKPGFIRAVADMHVVGSYLNPANTAAEADDNLVLADYIRSAAFSMVNGLATTITNKDDLDAAIETALDEPVPVITYNSGLQDYDTIHLDAGKEDGTPRVATHVGQNESDAGSQAGEMMATYPVSKVICIIHEKANDALAKRCTQFCSALRAAKSSATCESPREVWGSRPLDEIRESMKALLEGDWKDANGFLTLGPQFASILHGLIGESDNHSFSGADKVYYGTFDTSKDIYNAIANGEMQFAISQNPYSQGYLPVVFLALNAEIGVMPGAGLPIYTGPNFVTDPTTANKMAVIDYNDPSSAIKRREDIRIAIVAHGTGLRSTFWGPVFRGVQQAASDLGVQVEYHHSSRKINYHAEYDYDENKSLLEKYGVTNSKIDGLAFSVFNDELVEVLQAQCMNAGKTGPSRLPCVSLNSGMNAKFDGKGTGSFTHVGMDEYQAGTVGGEAFKARGAQKVVCVQHDLTNSAMKKRCEGGQMFNCEDGSEFDDTEPSVNDALKSKCEADNTREYVHLKDLLLASTSCVGGQDDWQCTSNPGSCKYGTGDFPTGCCTCPDASGAMHEVYRDENKDKTPNDEFVNALANYFKGAGADFDGVFTVGGPVAGYLAQAFKKLGITGSKKIGSFDCPLATIRAIRAVPQEQTFCLDQQPFLQGYLPVVLLTNAIEWGEKVGGGKPVYSGPTVVDKDNAGDVEQYALMGYR